MSVPILQEIQSKIKSNWDLATGEAAKEIYSSLFDLTGQVILLAQTIAPSTVSVPDQVTNLKTQVDQLNGLMNEQADCLYRTAGILTADNAAQLTPQQITDRALVVQLTSHQTVDRALAVMTELIALRQQKGTP